TDVVIEGANQGTADRIEAIISYSLPDNVEVLVLTGNAAINGIGNDIDNSLEGNSNANQLFGGEGNDNILGGAGNDMLDGENGSDTLYGGLGDDFLNGGAGNDLLFGEEGDDLLFGGAGNDTLHGGGGNDVLEGGEGTDIALFLKPYSEYSIIKVGDTFSLVDMQTNTVTQLTEFENIQFSDELVPISAVLPPTISLQPVSLNEGDSGFSSAQLVVSLSHSSLSSVQVDYATVANTATSASDYNAVTGTLVFAPSETQKTLTVSILGDTRLEEDETLSMTLSNPNNALLTVVNSALITIINDDVDFFDGEDEILSSGNDYLVGTPLSDRIDGLAGNDTIIGNAKNDSLMGSEGQDSLVGGEGRDTLEGGLDNDSLDGLTGETDTTNASADFMDGGEGNDTLIGGVLDTLIGGLGNDRLEGQSPYLDGGEGNDYIYCNYFNNAETTTLNGGLGNDKIYFDGYNSVLTGDGGNDLLEAYALGQTTIDGGLGNDTIYGGELNDRLLGAEGNDKIYDYGGDDYLDGGSGNDAIDGSYGKDTMVGGLGVDKLIGGYNYDLFIFAAGDSGVGVGRRDKITDFDTFSLSEERIDLSAVSTESLSFQGNAPFTANNQLRVEFNTTTRYTLLQINLDDDLETVEMEIELTGILDINAAYFIL
ncbi:MAG: Calx-beta domain-containing protein, partial [Methylovulum sp.]